MFDWCTLSCGEIEGVKVKDGFFEPADSSLPPFVGHELLLKRIDDDSLEPYCIEEKEGTRRQDYDPPAYMRNGAIYLTRREVLMEHDSIWGQRIRPYVMPPERSVGVDSELDLKRVELLIKEKQTTS